jgi:ABC-type Mn2+/Zn2+ transport system permease subunit
MFELEFMRLALAASMATGVSLGVMGVYLVIRRVVFLGLVVANMATLGAAIAETLSWPTEIASLVAAVGAAVAFGGRPESIRMSGESLMGWAYAAASSLTVLVLAWVAGGSTDTLHLLYGNVLAVQRLEVVNLVIVAVAVLTTLAVFSRRFILVSFDPEAARVSGVWTRGWLLALGLAVGVTSATAVEAIGALSTFALLVLPSTIALLIAGSVRSTFVLAAVVGALAPSIGLAISFYLDLPAGPTSVALLAAGVPVSALLRRIAAARRGAVAAAAP